MNKIVKLLLVYVSLSFLVTNQLVPGFLDNLKSKKKEVRIEAEQKLDEARRASVEAIQVTKQKLIAAEEVAKKKMIEAEKIAIKIKREAQKQYELAVNKTKEFINKYK
jgi:hypothetical protein